MIVDGDLMEAWLIRALMWDDERAKLSDHEATHGSFPHPDAMFESDDAGVELVWQMMNILRGPNGT